MPVTSNHRALGNGSPGFHTCSSTQITIVPSTFPLLGGCTTPPGPEETRGIICGAARIFTRSVAVVGSATQSEWLHSHSRHLPLTATLDLTTSPPSTLKSQ